MSQSTAAVSSSEPLVHTCLTCQKSLWNKVVVLAELLADTALQWDLLITAAPVMGSQTSLSSRLGCCVPPHYGHPPAIAVKAQSRVRETSQLLITQHIYSLLLWLHLELLKQNSTNTKSTQIIAGVTETLQNGPCSTGLPGGTGATTAGEQRGLSTSKAQTAAARNFHTHTST